MSSVFQLALLSIALIFFQHVSADAFKPIPSNVKASCLEARVVDNSQKYCGMASWTAAHIYANVNYTDYSPGAPLSDSQQNDYASNIYDALVFDYGKPVKTECSQALERLACVTAFPMCPVAGTSISSISYSLPCRLQCEQANARCPFVIACGDYPTSNCMMTLPTGYFVIDPESGPFEPLPIIYAISLGMWTIFAITWNYLTFVKYKNACVIFCRVVSGVPIIKGK